MQTAALLETFLAATAGASVALAVLLVSMVLFRRRAISGRQLLAEAEGRAAFLFDGADLFDATPAARDLMSHAPQHGTDWDRLLALLGPSFPDLAGRAADLGATQKFSVDGFGAAADSRLEAEYWDGIVRLMIVPDEGVALNAAAGPIGDAVATAALEAELETLRTLAEDAPQLIWQLDRDGEIVWANRAYLDLAMAAEGAESGALPPWPPAQLFESINTAPLHGEATRRRVALPARRGGDLNWFEVTSLRRGSGSVHFAADANDLVRAEKAQRNFVQTLTKTFADLSIGMVIFDRHRRLVLFNPAFLDMSGLPADFLSARPVIQSVLDRLRESRVLPEPKNYASWRDQMAALESAASDGTYFENWNLPTGQTFRVTGRPHPDGAIAFLFEDITAEISLTRRFRSELEFGQSVIDNIDEAVVVFSAAGTQIATNRGYHELWAGDDEPGAPGGGAASLAETTLSDAIDLWRRKCIPTAIWRDLRDFVSDGRQRAEWSETARMTDGRRLLCRFVPLVGGTTMVTFRIEAGRGSDSATTDTRERGAPLGLASASG